MIPQYFPQRNKTLRKPDGMTDTECASLHVFTDGEICVSQWRASWRERLSILFKGTVWLRVRSGTTQPPVKIQTADPFP